MGANSFPLGLNTNIPRAYHRPIPARHSIKREAPVETGAVTKTNCL